MEDDMTMAVVDGVLARSYWLSEEDDWDRLRQGVGVAREIAADYGEEVRCVDLDPMEGDEDVLRVHAWTDGDQILAHVNLEEGNAKVYRVPA